MAEGRVRIAESVLVSDKLHPDGLAVLHAAEGLEVEHRPGLGEDALCEVIGGYDALVIRSDTRVTQRVLESAKRLRVIGRAGIGVDNVQVEAASAKGVVVMNTPTGNAVTTAEHAISLLLSLARKIPQAHRSVVSGQWQRARFQGTELAGKTVGIVGLGNIGRIVADRAQGLKMHVIATDPVLSPEKASELGVELVQLPELLQRADCISLHAPLIPETRNLIGEAALRLVKPTALLVNAARGGIVDEQALARALAEGRLAGAALDVLEQEPVRPDHPLLKSDRVVFTPHLGASTAEAQARVAVEIAQQVVAFLNNGVVQNAVNLPGPPRDAVARFEPYLRTARRLGRVLSQLSAVDVREFRVAVSGEAAAAAMRPIVSQALTGYLEHLVEGRVNPVNAPHLAKARGIRIAEVREEPEGRHPGKVTVTVSGAKGQHTALGLPGSHQEPLLIGLDGYDLDAVLEGTTLVMRNQDTPGVIGAVGTLLGSRGINVSRMQVGLNGDHGEAMAVWSVDSLPEADTLRELEELPDVDTVACVHLS